MAKRGNKGETVFTLHSLRLPLIFHNRKFVLRFVSPEWQASKQAATTTRRTQRAKLLADAIKNCPFNDDDSRKQVMGMRKGKGEMKKKKLIYRCAIKVCQLLWHGVRYLQSDYFFLQPRSPLKFISSYVRAEQQQQQQQQQTANKHPTNNSISFFAGNY